MYPYDYDESSFGLVLVCYPFFLLNKRVLSLKIWTIENMVNRKYLK